MMMEKLIEQEAMMELEDQKVQIKKKECVYACVGEEEGKTGPRKELNMNPTSKSREVII